MSAVTDAVVVVSIEIFEFCYVNKGRRRKRTSGPLTGSELDMGTRPSQQAQAGRIAWTKSGSRGDGGKRGLFVDVGDVSWGRGVYYPSFCACLIKEGGKGKVEMVAR